jgi:hypothetical protein
MNLVVKPRLIVSGDSFSMMALPVSARVFEETPGLRALARFAISPSDG